MQNAIIDKINKAQMKKRPAFSVGDRINVWVRLKEGDKERLQAFRGVVIAKHPKSGNGPRATFTVRKVSEGVGVERVFPLHSPFIDRLEIEGSSEIRRSRLYYLRDLKGKKARLKEAERFGDLLVVEEPTAVTGEISASEPIATSASAETKKEK